MKRSFVILIILGLAYRESAGGDRPFVAAFERFARHGDIDPTSAGSLLISELSCTACHSSPNETLRPKRGPVLDGVGRRLKAEWLRRFLMDPTSEKHGTTMPNVLSSLPEHQRSQAIEALVAAMMAMQQPFPEVKASGANPVPEEFWNKGDAERGKKLYHQIGCVACHAADGSYDVVAVKPSPLDEMLDQLEPDELKELGLSSAARRFDSVPLPKLAEKYTSEALTFFLLNPEHTRPSGRMPNFQLQAVNAADIAASLLKIGDEKGREAETARRADALPLADAHEEMDAKLVQRGHELFVQLLCVNCHDIKGLSAQPAAMSFEQLDLASKRSCVRSEEVTATGKDTSKPDASDRRIGQPMFVVDRFQEQALAASKNTNEALDGLSLRLLQHNCYACHERNTLGGVGRDRKPYFETVGGSDIGDEGRLPPALSGVGKRLTINWMTTVLNGKGIIRPHMTIRMPVFPPEVTKPLPMLIAAADGAVSKPVPAEQVFVKADREELLKAGRQLMDTGCVQCHAFKGEALPGVVGVDLEGVTQRLHADWLHDFLKDPGALKARTRMPTFFPNGRSQNPDVLGGDTELQLAAMHAYLGDLANQPLPAKIEEARSKNYELTPTDRPIILRTFMPNAGTHAIAVGNPQKVHFAFDAEQVRLAEIWQGRFLDVEGTWFVRSAPPASPLGDHRFQLPTAPMIARLESFETSWPSTANLPTQFRGYRVGRVGVPTFLYDIGQLEITDCIAAIDEHTLRRTISFKPKSPAPATTRQFWLRVASNLPQTAVIKTSPGTNTDSVQHTIINADGLTVSLLLPTASKVIDVGRLRTVGGSADWILPVGWETDVSLEIDYRW
jgi:mono/diheme cytochrome c family protein